MHARDSRVACASARRRNRPRLRLESRRRLYGLRSQADRHVPQGAAEHEQSDHRRLRRNHLRQDRRHSGGMAARRECPGPAIPILCKGRRPSRRAAARHDRAHGQVPPSRPVRERLHAELPHLGREVRARLARVPDHAGVDVLEADRRHVGLHRRSLAGVRQGARHDGARARPPAQFEVHAPAAPGRQGESGRVHRDDLERLSPVGRRLHVQLLDPVGDDGGRRARQPGRDRA